MRVNRATAAAAIALAITGASISACVSPAGRTTPAKPLAGGQVTAPRTPSAWVSPGPTRTLTTGPSVTPTPTPMQVAELPRGGRDLFPRYRLVGYAGREGAEALGRLGIGDLDERAAELEKRALPYRENREIMPVFEVIATVVQRQPGADAMYRVRAEDAIIQKYLDAARRHRALLLLNVQPGRADFLPEVKAYEKWLREPDVGIALDPEWAVDAGQLPGRVYGRTTGNELDSVAAYLADLVYRHDLPEKVFVFHQVHASIVSGEEDLRDHPGVVIIKSIDGIGSAGAKEATWTRLTGDIPPHFHSGFKLFYIEDLEHGPLMTPAQVLALTPKPDYVMHE